MSNMSYCRFYNTLGDLRDCQDHLDDDEGEMNLEERLARLRLIKRCVEIARDHGLEVGADGDNLQVDEDLFKRSLTRIRERRGIET